MPAWPPRRVRVRYAGRPGVGLLASTLQVAPSRMMSDPAETFSMGVGLVGWWGYIIYCSSLRPCEASCGPAGGGCGRLPGVRL
nr:MAG TPA: hypothetical protein [Caudoviricetes sp.]